MKNGKKAAKKVHPDVITFQEANNNLVNANESLLHDLKRVIEQRDDARNLTRRLEEANENAAILRQAIFRGFAQERDEKYAEIYSLENRMRSLGYDLPDDRKAGV